MRATAGLLLLEDALCQHLLAQKKHPPGLDKDSKLNQYHLTEITMNGRLVL